MTVKKKKKKVKKKKPGNKKLQKQCLDLAKQICKTRDNNECQLHKHYPSIGIECSGYLQADHGVTRACKKYFVDPRNLTWVCGSANRAKYYKHKSVDECIRQIVVNREGQPFWDEMNQFNMSKSGFVEWRKVSWLEVQKSMLEQQLEGMNGRTMESN